MLLFLLKKIRDIFAVVPDLEWVLFVGPIYVGHIYLLNDQERKINA